MALETFIESNLFFYFGTMEEMETFKGSIESYV